jgi:hypothetical protein
MGWSCRTSAKRRAPPQRDTPEPDEQIKATLIANELKKRHDWVMNPTGNSTTQLLSTGAFAWYLAASPRRR